MNPTFTAMHETAEIVNIAERFTYPGLFEANNQIRYIREAINLSSSDYPQEFVAPEFPDPISFEDPTVKKILEQVLYLDGPLPKPCSEGQEEEFKAALKILKYPLLKWLEDLLSEVTTPKFFNIGDIPYDLGVKISRSLFVLHRLDEETSLVHGMHRAYSYVYGLVAVFRYTKSIIARIAEELLIQYANTRTSMGRKYLKKIRHLVYNWLTFAEKNLPEELDRAVSRFSFF